MGETSSLLIIGNEILSGRTMDRNANYIAQQMTKHGVPLSEVRVVPDIEEKIIEAVNALRAEYDYVFTTGGIGPTHDDITAASLSKAVDAKFGRHEGAYQALLEYYGPEELTDVRARMADMPEGAELISNPVSGAPGFKIENVFVMAGVPKIMEAMLDHVIAQIAPGDPILSNTVSCTLQESVMAEALGCIQDRFNSVDVGSYPAFKDGKLTVGVVVKGTVAKDIADATKAVMEAIEERGGVITRTDFKVNP